MIIAVIEENPIEKKPLGRPRLRWEDCMKSIESGIKLEEVVEVVENK